MYIYNLHDLQVWHKFLWQYWALIWHSITLCHKTLTITSNTKCTKTDTVICRYKYNKTWNSCTAFFTFFTFYLVPTIPKPGLVIVRTEKLWSVLCPRQKNPHYVDHQHSANQDKHLGVSNGKYLLQWVKSSGSAHQYELTFCWLPWIAHCHLSLNQT